MGWTEESDFIIIGSGAAGLMAALTAAKAGRSVIVLERSDKVGGTTAFSGSLLWVPLNPKGDEIGFRDDRETVINYICDTMGGPPDRELVSAFVDSAAETIRFLETETPIRLMNTPYPDTFPDLPGGVAAGRHLEPDYFPLRSLGKYRHRVRSSPIPGLFTSKDMMAGGFIAQLHRIVRSNIPRIVWRLITARRSGGNALIAAMMKACLDHGVRFEFNARVTRLVMDDGTVTGVETENRRYRARAAVVLACGGFEQNPELVAKYLPVPLNRLPTPPGLNTGDNITLAEQAGAALARMDTFWNWPAFSKPGDTYEGHPIGTLMIGERTLPHSIWVNRDGKRFCNEAEHNVAFAFEKRDTVGNFINLPAWAIVDGQYREKYPLLFKYMPGSKDPDWIMKAESLDALAAKIGVDAQGLHDTIKHFNVMAHSGEDTDFGRGRYGYERTLGDRNAAHPNLGTIEKPPFYAVQVFASAVGTRGGARTDADARVLRPNGSVIAGLYGAGNAVACAFGPKTMGGGATIMPAMTFARRGILHALKTNRDSSR